MTPETSHQTMSLGEPSRPGQLFSDEQILQEAERILRQRAWTGGAIHSEDDALDYLRFQMRDYTREVFGVIWLNKANQVIATEELATGTLDGMTVHVREVVRQALTVNAGAAIFYHNHPSGSASPSPADVRFTDTLMEALGHVDVQMIDHFVVTTSAVVSVYSNGSRTRRACA